MTLHAAAVRKIVDVVEPRLVEIVALMSSNVTPNARPFAVDHRLTCGACGAAFDIDLCSTGLALAAAISRSAAATSAG